MKSNSIVDAVRDQCRCGGFCEEGLVCESHPWLGWPHDDCGGPGMPCSQPIRSSWPLSGELFITHEEVFAAPGAQGKRREDALCDEVLRLGLRAEDYIAWEDHLRCGWYLERKRAPR